MFNWFKKLPDPKVGEVFALKHEDPFIVCEVLILDTKLGWVKYAFYDIDRNDDVAMSGDSTMPIKEFLIVYKKVE